MLIKITYSAFCLLDLQPNIVVCFGVPITTSPTTTRAVWREREREGGKRSKQKRSTAKAYPKSALSWKPFPPTINWKRKSNWNINWKKIIAWGEKQLPNTSLFCLPIQQNQFCNDSLCLNKCIFSATNLWTDTPSCNLLRRNWKVELQIRLELAGVLSNAGTEGKILTKIILPRNISTWQKKKFCWLYATHSSVWELGPRSYLT